MRLYNMELQMGNYQNVKVAGLATSIGICMTWLWGLFSTIPLAPEVAVSFGAILAPLVNKLYEVLSVDKENDDAQ